MLQYYYGFCSTINSQVVITDSQSIAAKTWEAGNIEYLQRLKNGKSLPVQQSCLKKVRDNTSVQKQLAFLLLKHWSLNHGYQQPDCFISTRICRRYHSKGPWQTVQESLWQVLLWRKAPRCMYVQVGVVHTNTCRCTPFFLNSLDLFRFSQHFPCQSPTYCFSLAHHTPQSK